MQSFIPIGSTMSEWRDSIGQWKDRFVLNTLCHKPNHRSEVHHTNSYYSTTVNNRLLKYFWICIALNIMKLFLSRLIQVLKNRSYFCCQQRLVFNWVSKLLPVNKPNYVALQCDVVFLLLHGLRQPKIAAWAASRFLNFLLTKSQT